VSATYSGNPSSSPLDEIRFLIGDTDLTDPRLTDSEIQYNIVLVSGSNPPPPNKNFLAASYCAEAIAGKFSRMVDKSVGDLHISYSQLAKQYSALSLRLRSRAALASVPVYVGGLSKADKDLQRHDKDLLSTAIKVDGMTSRNLWPNGTDGSDNTGL
jgi:hypothetical protein